MAGIKEARRPPADKHDERRDQLAESALRTLGERGYARTSLREIANNSEFSHGVVHYYFADKLELIVYSVRYYKARCVTRYDGVVAESTTAGGAARRGSRPSWWRRCRTRRRCTASGTTCAPRACSRRTSARRSPTSTRRSRR